MDDNDDRMFDPLRAFIAGSVLGAALALLMGPRRSPELRKEFKRAAKKTRKDFKRSGKRLRGTTYDIVGDGAHVLADIRKDLEKFIEDARDGLREVVNDEMKALEKGLGRRKSRLFG